LVCGANDLQQETEQIENWIDGCIKNDRRAQEALYKAYYRAMVSLCLRYTGSSEDAVDVLNNGFFKVFKNIQQYDRKKGSLYTWIRILVINSCLDFIKQKEKIISGQELEEGMEVAIPPGVLEKIEADELLASIRKLPPATGAVFNLFAIEGFTHKEIAAMMRISEGTSKWHLSEARRKLQSMIQSENIHEREI
jgi:RNA polymerase sigma factor (sigma-70 family)